MINPLLPLAFVAAGLLVLCAPVVVHHLADDLRERRRHRRALELHHVRIRAHQARKWAQIAKDDDAIRAALAERDHARRLVTNLIAQLDQAKAAVEQATRERDAARMFGRKLESDRFALATHAIEVEQTQPMPIIPPGSRATRELPRVRRPILEAVPA